MPQTRETLFLVEWGRQWGGEVCWEPVETAPLLDSAIAKARGFREKYPASIRIRRVDVVRTSEVLAEWDHGELVSESGVAR